MIVVDTSVWVDYFNGVPTRQATALDRLLGERPIAVGDLVLAELLQGLSTEADANTVVEFLEPFDFVAMGGRELALASAANYRRLRRRGVTIRKTIDMLIGTYCVLGGHELLHSDRDFDLLEKHLGLRTVRA